jgi:hypothetical protein
MFDLRNPFFEPLWIRILVSAVCLGWGMFEFATASPFWGVLFAGIGLNCVYVFFFNFKPQDKQSGSEKDSDE